MPVREARARLDGLYRLLPDRRFLSALGEVERLLRASERVSLRASFADGLWTVSIGDEIIATLPEYPTFEDGFAAVLSRTRRLLADHPTVAEETAEDLGNIELRLAKFWPANVFAALQELDQRWQAIPSRPVARLAASAHLWLCIQTINGMEMADSLVSRSFALQAIATAQGVDDLGERALLAWMMGYPGEAKTYALRLSPENGVRAFLTGELEDLLRKARGKSPIVRYLALIELSFAGREQQWEEWLEKELPPADLSSPSILRAARGFNRFENRPDWSLAVIQSASAGVSHKPAVRAPTPAPVSGGLVARLVDNIVARATARSGRRALLGDFERDLVRHCEEGSRGRLWDRDSCKTYWRSHFYAGVGTLGEYYLDRLASGPAALEFAKGLQDAPLSGPGAQFSRWYGDLASWRGGAPASERELDDLEAIPDLGGWAASRLFDAAREIFPWKPYLASEAVHRLAGNLDTRPDHQAMLLPALRHPLLDMRRVERTCGNAAFRAGETERWTVWCALLQGDHAGILRQVQRKDRSLQTRVDALFTAGSLLLPPKVRTEYRKLLAESGYSGTVAYSYLYYLDQFAPDPVEKESVVRAWLARHASLKGTLEHSIYSGRLARAISEQGRHQEAWSLLEPLVDTWQAGIMVSAARILQELDRGEEAMQLGRAALERYPFEDTVRARLAYLLWRNDRHSEAADILNPRQFRVQTHSWDLLGAEFRDAMEGKEDAEVIRAIEAVREGNSNIVLDRFLMPTSLSRPDLAFRFYSTLKTMGHEFAKAKLDAYLYLRDKKGEEEASRWLRLQLAKGSQDMVAPFFFERAEYVALWDPLEPAPGTAALSSATWLLRAAGSLFAPLSEPRRERLLEHFRDRRPADFHHVLGRFLLDLEPPEALDSLAKTRHEKSDAATVHGIRTLSSGDYEDASEWFQLAVLMEPMNSPFWHFASAQLGRWYTGNRTLRLQASFAPASAKAGPQRKPAIE